ncbi:MAG: DUF4097 domain-containing protein [Ruminococcaceae bacterium]|nr:DUF4097 domain-containing protein [Oscillospiraceae bacterium]
MKENLRTYLESLFAGAPHTEKNEMLFEELLGNLYDRYEDLTATEMPPEEAFAKVVGEVGDIRPLMDAPSGNSSTRSAPTTPFSPKKPNNQRPRMDAISLRRLKRRRALTTSLAVMLYLVWLVPVVLFDVVAPLFICAALGTCILILGSALIPDFADDSEISYDPAVRQRDTFVAGLLLSVGVGLCILSVLPAAIIDAALGAALMFAVITLGVGMILFSTGIRPSLDKECERFADQQDSAKKQTPYEGKSGKTRSLLLPMVIVSVIAVLTTVIVLGIRSGFEFGIFYRNSDSPAKYTNRGNASITETVDRVTLHWHAGDIRVEVYDGDTVEIAEAREGAELGEKDIMRWYVENGELRVRFDGRSQFRVRFGKSIEKSLTVRIPRTATLHGFTLDTLSGGITVCDLSVTGTVKLKGTSARIGIDRVHATRLEIDAVSGEMLLRDITANEISIDRTSGTTVLENATASTLNIESVSGDIVLRGGSPERVEASSTSGNIELSFDQAPRTVSVDTTGGDVRLSLPADIGGFRVEYDTVGGDFNTDFATMHHQGIYTYGDGSTEIEIETTGGNLTVAGKQR